MEKSSDKETGTTVLVGDSTTCPGILTVENRSIAETDIQVVGEMDTEGTDTASRTDLNPCMMATGEHSERRAVVQAGNKERGPGIDIPDVGSGNTETAVAEFEPSLETVAVPCIGHYKSVLERKGSGKDRCQFQVKGCS